MYKESIFNHHYNYYKGIGVETIKQQSGQIEQVSSDYQGRVIYELLQNAFDKADEQILLKISGNSLYIANDGKKFTYTSKFDYISGSSKRGDFQSLCSISTSTKNISHSIGNKGVGFKSCFSVAADGFVNIYTKGEIVDNEKIIDEIINFRIYDVFRDISSLGDDFPDTLKQDISNTLALVQKERPDRGIPGYYFPLILNEVPPEVEVLISKGYVSVIEIPYEDREVIDALIKEIREIHFEFVKIKYPYFDQTLEIRFEGFGEDFVKQVSSNGHFFTSKVVSPKLHDLAKAAGLNLNQIEVGVKLRDKPGGLLYNYMPTQVLSPFPYVDFHADFHTTVDRKAINFDGKVGDYNQALLRSCIELYFILLKGQMSKNIKCSIGLYYVNFKVSNGHYFFTPQLLSLRDDYRLFYTVRDILGIDNDVYGNASDFLAGLGKRYFESSRSVQEHEDYLSLCSKFVTFFARTDYQQYHWIKNFKASFAAAIKDYKVKIVPDISITRSSELFYRKNADQKMSLPAFLGVSITDFKVPDAELSDALGIKEFSESNEILKYFKQCTFEGDVSDIHFTEKEQQKLLGNVYRLFKIKNSQSNLSTHRFTKAATLWDRERNSPMNQANFNIATLFLKTLDRKYKPAQLCRVSEVDRDFLSFFDSDEEYNGFMRFLGVSYDSTYLFADKRIYSQLSKGLKYIPKPIQRKIAREDISAELIKNFYIISPKESVHPALINNNDYRFLFNINRISLREEFDNLLVKNYSKFPPEYTEVLRETLRRSLSYKSDMIRLYLSVYKLFEKDKQFLVLENQQLAWVEGYGFKAVGNRSDFELYSQLKDRKLLCIYAAHQMEDVVKEQLISSQKGEIIIDNRQTDLSLKALLMEKIIYILLSISHSGNSEVNYLEDDRDLSPLQEKIDNMEIVRGMDLLQEIHFGEDKVVSGKSYAFKAHGNELYFEQNSTNSQIAAGISEYLFDNLSIAESLELILFHKETQVLILEYDPKEVANINKKWKKDFIGKFRKFQKEILQDYELLGEDNEKWYIYNTNHKSKLLIALDNLGRLEELSEKIAILKESESYIGYFDGFDLEIDRSDLINRVSALRLLAENVREISEELRSELLAISPQLGNEDKIHELEQFVADAMPLISQEQIEMKQHEVTIQSRLESIFERLSSFAKASTRLGLQGGKKTEIKAKKKALVFMGNAVGGNSELDLAAMGATGEEEVLAYVILQFLELSKHKQLQAIEEIYEVLRKKLSIPSLEGYKTACIEAVGKREELARNLIPFLYVTLHAKYAYFDLISYMDNVPTLIEVKTTYNDKNNRFFMSAAEIDAARGGEAYQIVRVSPSAITFLGNPISLVERQLAKITGDNFTITPRNYEVKLHI